MNSLAQISQRAARRFLQSAVFIDDQIYDQQSGRPIVLPADEEPQLRKPVLADRDRVRAGVTEVDVPEATQFRPRDLVGSFAKEGIVCALYEPEKEFETGVGSQVFTLCQQADLVILDWDFSNDAGAKMRGLVSAIVKQSLDAVPHYMRLLAIYTTDKSLHKVANTLFEDLAAQSIPVVAGGQPTTLVCGSTTIVVYGKQGVERIQEEVGLTVRESDLATRLIEQFASMSVGLLPSWALIGMAAIRQNAGRILDRFRKDMDGAFLLHRALVMSSEEAFEHLPRLLSDEFLAVLEDDTEVQQASHRNVANAAIREFQPQRPPAGWHDMKQGDEVDAGDAVRAFLTEGKKGLAAFIADCKEAKKIYDRLPKVNPTHMADLTKMVDVNNTSSSKRLAELFGVQTSYSSGPKSLLFGTIVREVSTGDAPESYSMCLMPLCDSLRLPQGANGVAFPFWRLTRNADFASEPGGRGIVVETPSGFADLVANGKPADNLWLESFDVDSESATVRTSAGAPLSFQGKTKAVQWIALLKPLHAQRIAHDIGQLLSRVGLVEAEWVRLMCDR